MAWWMWIWTAVLALLTISGAVIDLEDDEPSWCTAMGITSGLACIVFLLNDQGVVQFGNLTPVALMTLAALLYGSWRDFGKMEKSTQAEKFLATILALTPFVPAVALGLLDALK